MADDFHVEDATVQLAVAAAIAAAGPAGSGGKQWRDRVMAKLPEVAAMMASGSRPASLARQVLEAPHFSVVFDRMEMEESSKRGCVYLINHRGEFERVIRTNPSYTPHGAALIAKLQQLRKGDEIRVWKAIEEASTSNPSDPKKVRVLVHFEFVKPASQGQEVPPASDDGPPPSPGDGTEEGPAQGSPSSASAPSDHPTDAVGAIRAQLRNLPPDKREMIVKAFHRKGWASADQIPADDHELALYMSLHEGEEPF